MLTTTSRKVAAAVVAVIVLLGVILGPRLVSNLTKKTVAPQLATASFRSFPVVATATGSLVPSSQVSLNFSLSGQLTAVSVVVGQQVTAGQVIARISDVAEQADLQAANAALQSARAALTAALTPGIPGHTPNPGQVQVADAQIAAAVAQIARAKAALSQTVLTSPTAGTVLAINAQVGELVGPSLSGSQGTQPGSGTGVGGSTPTRAFALIGDAAVLHGSAGFAESDASRLTPGQSGSFTADAVPGLTIPCHLLGLSSTSTNVNGVVQYIGTLGLDVTDPRLRNGMTINVSINVARADNVLAVPNQALYLLDGRLHVDVWYQNRAVPTIVTTGLVGSELTQVTAGLTDGQQIVLSAPHGLPSPAPTG